jgi:hypothetical protein
MTSVPLSSLSTARDILIERRVDELIAAGCRLPRWGWRTPTSYNGATGVERISGWQKLHIACKHGWIDWHQECSICGRTSSLHYHAENYFRPLVVEAVCRSCHFRIHRRWREPDVWLRFLAQHAGAQWIAKLRTRELTRSEAMALAKKVDPAGGRQIET